MLNNKQITEITTNAFTELGPLSKLIKNYVPNPVQIRYAIKAASVFESGSKNKPPIGLIEAGTGIGKTLGYAIPLMTYATLTGKRVAISTYTVQLLSQLLTTGGDIDIAQQVVEELTGKRLTIAPRLGLRNFVSPTRIRAAIAEKNITLENAPAFVMEFLRWAETSKTGLLMEWNKLHGEVPQGFLISEICCEQYLPDTEKKRYLAHKERAKSADVIITNHTLLLLHTASKNYSVLDDAESRPLSIIVADEADRIEDAAQLLSNGSAALVHMKSLFSKQNSSVSDVISKGLGDILDIAKTADTKISTHFNLHDNPGVASRISRQITKILPSFDKLLAKCDDRDLHAEFSLCKGALTKINKTLSTDSGWTTPVIHYSEVKRYPSLRAIDPSPGKSLGWLWHGTPENEPYIDAVLLTSATLSDGQESSLKTIANGFGAFLSKTHVLTTAIFEPTDFGVLSIVLPDINAPTPTLSCADDEFTSNPDWIDYVSQMVIKASASGERVLVLTLSYRDTCMIADQLRAMKADLTTLIQHTESDPIQDLLKRFATEDGAILLSPSCWEGVNLPGLVKNLVITRIPFAPPDPALADIIKRSMRKKLVPEKTISAVVYGLSVNRARRKLRQAIGRGIRQKNDVSRIWIGDKRILGQKGKLRLESCLPVRFHKALQKAETFTLNKVVEPPTKSDTISWASLGEYS
ncbi:MAG: ATP-dependent DNA helicase [Methylococcales bacterium]|nr:ATP-dependent DNA helicase [Methylococcales bacterium]